MSSTTTRWRPIGSTEMILVLDLEATCGPSVPREEMETIEIGAVVIDGTGIVDSFSRFIRPTLHPITEYCTDLTTIRPEDVEGANGFSTVLREFEGWFSQYPIQFWSSWGAYDWKQIRKDCRLHGIPPSKLMTMRHVNAKEEYARLCSQKPCGLQKAIQTLGLTFEGTQHRALPDAIGVGKVILELQKRFP